MRPAARRERAAREADGREWPRWDWGAWRWSIFPAAAPAPAAAWVTRADPDAGAAAIAAREEERRWR